MKKSIACVLFAAIVPCAGLTLAEEVDSIHRYKSQLDSNAGLIKLEKRSEDGKVTTEYRVVNGDLEVAADTDLEQVFTEDSMSVDLKIDPKKKAELKKVKSNEFDSGYYYNYYYGHNYYYWQPAPIYYQPVTYYYYPQVTYYYYYYPRYHYGYIAY